MKLLHQQCLIKQQKSFRCLKTNNFCFKVRVESQIRNYDDILMEFNRNDSNTAIDQAINQINLDLLEKQRKEMKKRQGNSDEIQLIFK